MTTQLLDRPSGVSETAWAEIVEALTRREFLTGGAALAMLGLGTAAFGAPRADAAASSAGGWSFTDSRRHGLHLSARPKRVAFLCDTVAAALWAAGVHPVASTYDTGGVLQAVGMGMAGVRNIGSGVSQDDIDVEALAATKPDLLVDATLAGSDELQTVRLQPQLAKVAPVASLNVNTTVPSVIASADRLAAALGVRRADRGAQSRYDTAASHLRAVAGHKQGLRVGFVWADGTSGISLANPTAYPYMKTLRQLGVTLPAVTGGGYGQAFDWELVPSMPVDLLVWADASSEPPSSNPAWKAVPAVKAGQFWRPDPLSLYSYSWAVYGTFFGDLAGRLQSADPAVGPK